MAVAGGMAATGLVPVVTTFAVFCLRAIEQAGYKPYEDFMIAIDAASSEWKGEGGYRLPKHQTFLTTDQLIAYW